MANGSFLVWVFLWFGVAVLLAHQTAKDANRRGHDGNGWAAIVLLTGLLGVAFYLLSRNDRILDPEERPPRTSMSATPFVYLFAAFGGSVLFIFLGVAVANVIFPTASGEAYPNTIMAFTLLGFFAAPAALYKARKKGIDLLTPSVYLFVAFVGALSSMILGMVVADVLFPPPMGPGPAFDAPTQAHHNTIVLFTILGVLVAPYLFHRRRERGQPPTNH